MSGLSDLRGLWLWPRPKQNIVYTKQDKIFFKAGGELLNTAQASQAVF